MKKILLVATVIILAISSCDIEEKIYDEALGQSLIDNASPESLIAPVYAELRYFYGQRNLFALNCYAADEAMLPTRINDWYDGGTFQDLQRHSWSTTHSYVGSTWRSGMTGMARAAQAISLLEDGSSVEAEAKGLLALYMLQTLDLWSQVPYRDIKDVNFNTDPEILTGQKAIDKIIEIVEEAMPALPNSPNAIRFSKDAGKTLLARLYLNKAVYLDRYAASFNFDNADMEKVIELTTEVIGSGNYELETEDFFSIFGVDNENHKELIFAVKNETTLSYLGMGNGVSYNTTNSISRGLYLHPSVKGSDAACTVTEFLSTWDTSDPRFYKENYPSEEGWINPEDYKLNRGFLRGQQYGVERDSKGQFVTNEEGKYHIIPLISPKDGTLAIHTEEVNLVAKKHSSGVRCAKWDVDLSAGNKKYSGVDESVFRLAELYLMRAEAKLRSGKEGALADINAVREARKPGFGIDEATLDAVYKERGYEFYWEYMRRSDQIRFGTWEDAWTEKTSTDVTRRVYPIPEEQVTSTPGLEQNKGY